MVLSIAGQKENENARKALRPYQAGARRSSASCGLGRTEGRTRRRGRSRDRRRPLHPRPPPPGSGLRGAPDCRASVRCARRRRRPAGEGGGGERPPGAARPVPTSARPQLRLLPLDGARGFPTAREGAPGRAHKAPRAGGGRSQPARAREAGPPRPHAGPRARAGRSRGDLGAPASASTPSTLRPLGLGPGARLHFRERSREAGAGLGARGARVGAGVQTLAPRSPRPAAPGQAGRLSVSPASASRGSRQVRGWWLLEPSAEIVVREEV